MLSLQQTTPLVGVLLVNVGAFGFPALTLAGLVLFAPTAYRVLRQLATGER